MKDYQEQNWIEAARNGDQEAFGQLVRLYEKRVFALTTRMCRNPADAEEADSPQERSGSRSQDRKKLRDTSFVTVTRATPAHLWTEVSWRATPTECSRV